MKIHMHSMVFAPSVGGVEAVGQMLAEEWTRMGVEVRVTTETPGTDEGLTFPIIRRPARRALWESARWADLVFHNHPSTRVAWAPLIARKPWFATVHTWLPYFKRQGGFDIRRQLLLPCRFFAVSRAIAAHLPESRTTVVPNPYDAALFCDLEEKRQPRCGVLFVGRLVSDKGCAVLLEALGLLAARGIKPQLTVIGEGPEMPTLKVLAKTLKVSKQVSFTGGLSRHQVAKALCRSQITVVPSVWEEPFGLVALEALAGGSFPIVAKAGGLAEACAGFGACFKQGNAVELAEALEMALASGNASALDTTDPELIAHLARHERAAVATTYLERFATE